MNNHKNLFIIGGTVLLVAIGLAWSYQAKIVRLELIKQCTDDFRKLNMNDQPPSSYCSLFKKGILSEGNSWYCKDGMMYSHTIETWLDYCIKAKGSRL